MRVADEVVRASYYRKNKPGMARMNPMSIFKDPQLLKAINQVYSKIIRGEQLTEEDRYLYESQIGTRIRRVKTGRIAI